MKVIVTGASGVLGRAVAHHFHTAGDTVLPLSYTRTSSQVYPDLPKFIPLDLLDGNAIKELIEKEKPDSLIHCAAERRPDAAEKDPERAEKLNKDVVEKLATLCDAKDIFMVYISTDYVFDGQKPPYSPEDTTNPLQFYGRTKALGEQAVLETRKRHGSYPAGKGNVVLRVPILYGQVEYNAETAVNIFVDVIESAKQTKMDHFAVRYPTNVADVARVCYDLAHSERKLPAIVHFSSQRPFTKYEMTQVIGKALGKDISHVIPDTTDPSTLPPPADGSAPTPRPGNTQLSVKETEALGIDVREAQTFEEWWQEWALTGKQSKGENPYAAIEDLMERFPAQSGAIYSTVTDLALSQQWSDLRAFGLTSEWSVILGHKVPTDPLRLVVPLPIDADNLTARQLRHIFEALQKLKENELPDRLPSFLDDDEPTNPSVTAAAATEIDREAIYISIVTPDSSVVYYRLTKDIKKPADIPDE